MGDERESVVGTSAKAGRVAPTPAVFSIFFAKRIFVRFFSLRWLGYFRGPMVPVAGLVAIGVGVMAGCERQGSRQAEWEGGGSKQVTGVENPDALDEQSAQVVEHDFGIVAPKAKLAHRFGISNEGSIAWTLRKIVNACSCTAASVSASSIAPGQTEHVEVEYRAGDTTADSRQRVVILFEEPDAPVVMLVVKARVREAMSSFPAELAFRQLGRGQVRDANLEIQNFSDCAWRSLSVEPSVDWLAVSCMPVTGIAGEGLPRQVWRVTVGLQRAAWHIE